LSYAERGKLVGAVADVLVANRARYEDIAIANSGNTKADAAIDIDGGIGTLKYYARLGGGLGDARTLLDEKAVRLAKPENYQAIARVRGHPNVVARSVPVNIEADSINAALLAPESSPGSAAFDAFLREVVRAPARGRGLASLSRERGQVLLAPAASPDQVVGDQADAQLVARSPPVAGDATPPPAIIGHGRGRPRWKFSRIGREWRAVVAPVGPIDRRGSYDWCWRYHRGRCVVAPVRSIDRVGATTAGAGVTTAGGPYSYP
jgi:hypothetical protein